jgi:hypothetical protein
MISQEGRKEGYLRSLEIWQTGQASRTQLPASRVTRLEVPLQSRNFTPHGPSNDEKVDHIVS